jgi:FKBP-type peptidyl-prolyl cis-trans isomerase/predicted small secreted protein
MKKIILAVLVASTLLFACKPKDAAAETAGKDAGKDAAGTEAAASEKVSKADASYAFGYAIGTSLKETGVEMDYGAFVKGMKDVLENKKAKMTQEEATAKIQGAIAAAMEKKAAESIEAEKKYLAENGKKEGVVTTASGLQYQVIKEGTGAKPLSTDVVKVDYVGTLLNGSTFDSSIDRGEPAVFPLDRVIPGWSEGLQLMSVGGKYKFFIPSALAYGPSGAGGVIGPNETLIFEVDLLSIEAPQVNQ